MNKTFMKKVTSLALTGAIMFGFAGCMDFGGKKAVLEAANELGESIISADASAILDLTDLDEDSKEATAVTDRLSTDINSDDEIAFFEAVEKTMEFSVDEESFESKKGEASVDIVITMADYESVLSDTYTKIEDLTDAVAKADTKEITFTAEFKKDGKEWKADNVGSKKFMKIFDYRNEIIDLALTSSMIYGFIDQDMSAFWLANDGKYVDTILIEYSYYFDSAVTDYKDKDVKVFFTLSKDGTVVYTGEDVLFGESTIITCKVTNEQLGLGKNDYLEAGTYEVALYMKGEFGDELIDSDSITVEKTVKQPTTTSNGNGSKLKGEGEYYNFRDTVFRQHVLLGGWINVNKTLKNANTYTTDAKTIVFSLQVNDVNMEKVDYKYYFTEKTDKDSLNEALKNPVYSGSAAPKQFTDGIFYDFEYKLPEAKPGCYVCAVFKAGTNEMICVAIGFISQ